LIYDVGCDIVDIEYILDVVDGAKKVCEYFVISVWSIIFNVFDREYNDDGFGSLN
jgi:hypothetical protein